MSLDGVRTDYLGSVFDPSKFGRTVKRALELGRKALEKEQFDTIAFTGNSGAALSFILAAELKVALICVRKKTDNSHFVQCSGGNLVEGWLNAKRYIFVDDFISSGSTYKGLVAFLKEKLPNANCVGALLYASSKTGKFLDLPIYSYSEYDESSDGEQRSIKDWLMSYGSETYRQW